MATSLTDLIKNSEKCEEARAEIPQVLDYLEKSVSLLRERIDILGVQLEPVRATKPPSDDAEKRGTYISPLANSLMILVYQIKDATEKVSTLSSEVQL